MRKKETYSSLKNWVATQTTIIVIASVCIFALVEFFANYIVNGNHEYDAIDAIGMVLPMGAVMGIIAYWSSKIASRFMSRLIDGIKQIANGNFGIRLDEDNAGPMKDVYLDFNKMGRELQGIQTLRNDFINNFSHEFKTPISSIQGFASLLLEGNTTADEQKKYLQIIAKESARLAELSNNTLLLSGLEAQQIIVDKKPYQLDEQIKQCVILLSQEWTKKHIEFIAQLDPVIYFGNEDLMKHIWINLLSNAIKFTPEHGEISVIMKKFNNSIEVRVADTGKGMTKEEMERIFEKYYQGNQSYSTKGLGLGLTITKRIIELCGGMIQVESALDEGSKFTICLPDPK